MATFGFVYRDVCLDLKVEHRGVERYVPTRYEVRESEWDADTQWLKLGPVVTSRHRKLLHYHRAMARDLRCLRIAVNNLANARPGSNKGPNRANALSADDIASLYRRMVADYQMLGTYAHILSEEALHAEKPRTARGYITAIRRFIDFNRGYDIHLGDLSAEIVAMFEHALEREGLMPPTISFYMRNLRAMYNKAVSESIIPPRLENPFENAYTHIELTKQGELITQDTTVLSEI